VVKYGGNAMVSENLRNAVMSDIVLLSLIGVKVVLVHGGGPDITDTLEKMGVQSRFINGLRYTDAQTVKVVQMVLSGKTNKDLVAKMQSMGGRAMGLCGLDGGMLTAKKLEAEPDLGFVGEVTQVNTDPILDALRNGYIPIIATVAADAQGQVYNINADTAACKIATALGADKLINMTDVAGLLRDKNDESTLITEASIEEVDAYIQAGIIEGGMIPKIQGCVECLREGVGDAVIIDGRKAHSILLEIFSTRGSGTLFYRGEKASE
jgi:acetylglutamate kinase